MSELYLLRRPKEERVLLAGAISEWDVFDRKSNTLIGSIAQDDTKLTGGEGIRHLWHAWQWLEEEHESHVEALPTRYSNRHSAALDVYNEWKYLESHGRKNEGKADPRSSVIRFIP
jgi:hypothetical protein